MKFQNTKAFGRERRQIKGQRAMRAIKNGSKLSSMHLEHFGKKQVIFHHLTQTTASFCFWLFPRLYQVKGLGAQSGFCHGRQSNLHCNGNSEAVSCGHETNIYPQRIESLKPFVGKNKKNDTFSAFPQQIQLDSWKATIQL